MRLIQRYEYFSSQEEIDKFLDKFPRKNLTYTVVYDGKNKWALELIGKINEVKVVYNQGDGNV